MGEVARQTFKQVSETMFPGISETYKNQNMMYRKTSVGSYLGMGVNKKSPAIKLGNEIVSDLPLQMALFFNVCYFPAWLIISIVITTVKYDHLNYLYKFVLVTVLVAATVIEIIRLYLGYLGNLTEKVIIKIYGLKCDILIYSPFIFCHTFTYKNLVLGSRIGRILASYHFAPATIARIFTFQRSLDHLTNGESSKHVDGFDYLDTTCDWFHRSSEDYETPSQEVSSPSISFV